MFGMGFSEILLIAIVAVIFLGPDKLPSTMVQIAKFFKQTKETLGTFKDSIEQEMNVRELKDEALAYKKELLDASNSVKSATDTRSIAAKLTSFEDDSFMHNDSIDSSKEKTNKPEEVTLKKNKTKEDINV